MMNVAPHALLNPLASVRLVVFDWAGTTVDFGCFAPAVAFVKLFGDRGVTVSTAQARGPMGLGKRDHIVAMLGDPEVAAGWRAAQGRAWSEADVDEMYEAFAPIQLAAIAEHSELVPGVLQVADELRHRGVKIGGTTGYFRAAAKAVAAAARGQGFAPDVSFHADDVPAGRPAPWMMFRNMEALGIYPPSAVVKVGDTVPDIAEGLAAGVWSVGVLEASSEVGLSRDAFEALPASERRARLGAARARLVAAGSHAVIDALDELPGLLNRMAGRQPGVLEGAVGVV